MISNEEHFLSTNRYHTQVVNNKAGMHDFIQMPWLIYQDCPQYVPDMERDVAHVFDKRQNPGLASSDVAAFVAYDATGHAVGRIIGVINHKANEIWQNSCIRFGMIEFIDDYEVSRVLIDSVVKWGKPKFEAKGAEEPAGQTIVLEGPLGITDFDKEGMLIDSFDQVGSMISIYNPPYYPKHMERLGMDKAVDWIQIRIDLPAETPSRYVKAAKLVREMYEVNVRTLSRKDFLKKGAGKRIFQLLNKAYRPLFGFAELSDEQIEAFIRQYLPLIDLRMMPIVEDAEGNIVAVAVTMGSLTKALQRSKGRLSPTGWIHLLRAIKFRHEDKVEMLLIAVDPDFQGLGVNALIFDYLVPCYHRLGYKWAETGPMLEDNQKVLTQWRHLNPTIYKRRRCYQKKI